MSKEPSNGGAEPIGDGSRGENATLLHRHLKQRILSGDLKPAKWLSQVQIAKEYGVSRGPVREAIRLLESDGLIETQVNQRARVVQFSIADLEQLYAIRILSESFCVAAAAGRFDDAQLAEIRRLLDCLESLANGDVGKWEVVHRRFHLALVAPAGERMLDLVERSIDHSERYRAVYIARTPRAWTLGAGEHNDIVSACEERDGPKAGSMLARHLSRTALTLLMTAEPEHEPALVRNAVKLVMDGLDGRQA